MPYPFYCDILSLKTNGAFSRTVCYMNDNIPVIPKKVPFLKKLIPFYGPYKKVMALDLFCAFVTSACAIVFPVLVRKLLYDVIGAASIVWSSLAVLAALMLGVKFLEYAAKYYMTTIGHIMGARLETDIRLLLFDKFMSMPNSFYDNNKTGELMSRITTDLFDITEFSHHCPEELFIITVKFTGIFVYLMFINVPLTLIIFACLPVVIAVAYYFNVKMDKVWAENRKKIAHINAKLEDSLAGIRVIKSFATEQLEQERFKQNNLEFVKIKSKSYKYMGAFVGLTGLFSNLLYVVTAVIGAVAIAKQSISSVDLITYLLYISVLLQTVETLVQFTEQFQQGVSGFKRYVFVMGLPCPITDAPDALDAGRLEGNIAFDGVAFSYNEKGEKVLKNLSFEVRKGEHVAIVGPSGGGKTTMVNLIPRFYDVEQGSVSIDGVDIRKYTLKSLRRNIGIVQQDVYLFNGTIAENIAYGCENASAEQIRTAATLAGADEFILKFEEGYDTQVGERGVKLSGGQKQRISIARLFLKNPPVLILDEATSALDNQSEKQVLESLDKLSEGRTAITIAHRLTTVKGADRIIVLDNRGIAEQGSHEELISKNGLYAKYYKMYS